MDHARGSDQILADGPDGGLRAVGHADFTQDVLNVFFDGFVADPKHLCDLFVGQSQRHLTKHFAFALRQWNLDVLTQTAESPKHPSRDAVPRESTRIRLKLRSEAPRLAAREAPT